MKQPSCLARPAGLLALLWLLLPVLLVTAWDAGAVVAADERAGGNPGEPTAPQLIPEPAALTMHPGSLALTRDSRIVAGRRELGPLANVLSDEIFQATGLRLGVAIEGAGNPDGARAGDIALRIDDALKGEAYTIKVGESAEVSGGNYDAVASGSATLLQAMRAEGGRVRLPRMVVRDEPAYPYRGAMIDLARKYHTPGGIEQVVELCRLYKVRYLQLHLSDDQLFMFPSARFPWAGRGNREFARFEPPSVPPSLKSPAPGIGPYSVEALRGLERFARERGVHLVPEIDLPGHSGRLVGDVPDPFAITVGGKVVNGSTIDIARPEAVEAAGDLLDEVMDVFRSTPYVHLGADEVGMGGLEETAEYREARKKFPDVRSPHDLYCRFVTTLHDRVARRGKRAIVWEEAWNPAGPYPLPKDTLVMVWSRGRNPSEILRSGHDVINATWTPLYIVREDKRPLDFLFRWDITRFGREGADDYVTAGDAGDRGAKLAGAQLCSWENPECAEIQSLRGRLAVVAEKSWNPKADKADGFAAFTARLAHTDALLEELVHPLTIHVHGQLVRDENTFAEPITAELTPADTTPAGQPPDGLTIRYTLDNSLPGPHWKPYAGPIRLEQSAHLRAGLFDAAGAQHGYLSGAWFRRIVLVEPNLATGKSVTVGPGPDRSDAWAARVAVDGRADDVNAHWASTDPAPQWLRVDLGKVYDVDFINVITYWDGSRYYQFAAEVSTDGKEWKKVVDFSENKTPAGPAGYSRRFSKVQARYVRVNMLKNSANPFVHIVELIVGEAKG